MLPGSTQSLRDWSLAQVPLDCCALLKIPALGGKEGKCLSPRMLKHIGLGMNSFPHPFLTPEEIAFDSFSLLHVSEFVFAYTWVHMSGCT